MLEKGLKMTATTIVAAENTAEHMGSGDMPVFATPAMVALMENAAMLAVAPHLEAGNTTVGSAMTTSHLKPSGLGRTITAEAELLAVEGRKLTFRVQAFDQEGLIGEGEHIRYVVGREKFLSKVQ